MPPISKTNVRGFPHKQAGLYHISGRIHFYTAKVISHDGEGAVATGVRCPHAAFGRAGARPSRDTWRWRPRHRICLPFPTTARAHPSCDRLRGSLRSGDMSLREGRDSSRPRLSPPLGRNKCDPPAAHYHLPSTNYHLPTTNYPLPTTNYHLPTTIYQLPSTNFAPRWEDANSHRNSVV